LTSCSGGSVEVASCSVDDIKAATPTFGCAGSALTQVNECR